LGKASFPQLEKYLALSEEAVGGGRAILFYNKLKVQQNFWLRG